MKIVALTGAGISAESGLKTFRDSNGLWEGHDVGQVATPQGFGKNPQLVLQFYNQRRRQLQKAVPNAAHKALAHLEQNHTVTIITQNVDDLHERAGSTRVVHLHGELLKARSTGNPGTVLSWKGDIALGDRCSEGHQLRPHIVWFGEDVPMMGTAIAEVGTAAAILIIGTSMQVYPAAGLIRYAPQGAAIYFVDPRPSVAPLPRITVIPKKATVGVPIAIKHIETPKE
ncbi:MAG: SIR2 family NAD-dependent protein deacylase [Marinirhabdus sp.]